MNESEACLRHLLPKRDPRGHKRSFGHLTAVLGSANYRGAAVLAVGAALRSGVGLVRLLSTEPVIAAVASACPECTFTPLAPSQLGGIDASAFLAAMPSPSDTEALLVGCGMTPSRDTETIVAALLSTPIPLIIDADGLNVLPRFLPRLREAPTTPILTPHIGEMARLTGKTVSEIKAHRETIAARFAEENACVLVLKDAVTVVAAPDGRCAVCDRPNDGLSKGGSGDVLAGIVASLRAQGLAPYEAALGGVLLHSLAGEEAAARYGRISMLPSDLLACLPAVFSRLAKENEV